MLRDYRITSPSLEGVLDDTELSYEGLKRPIELLRVLDGPASKGKHPLAPKPDPRGDGSSAGNVCPADGKLLEQYLHDLYGIFMKRLAHFIIQSEASAEEKVTLQAMLQEMIKVKGYLAAR